MDLHPNLRLFADDTALYVTISTSSQSEILQKYLDNLERWSHKREMEFKPSKCQFIHVTRSKNPIPTQYTLHNCILQSVSSTKYLGVDISSDISWDTYIDRISKKANNTLCFLRRNIKIHSESLKSSAYKVLVCPQLEYCSTVWYPFTDSNISKLEAVLLRAARWVKHNYGQTSSVTDMMQTLHRGRLVHLNGRQQVFLMIFLFDRLEKSTSGAESSKRIQRSESCSKKYRNPWSLIIVANNTLCYNNSSTDSDA